MPQSPRMSGDTNGDIIGDIEAAEPLSPEYDIALSYTPISVRDAARCYLSLDRRLAQIIGQTTEPMLGQMRLAWWRDMLRTPIADRPAGDIVLTAAGQLWSGSEDALIALVDAWEEMLSEPPLPREAAMRFAQGRAAGFIELLRISSSDADKSDFKLTGKIEGVGQVWALVDAAVHIPDGEECAMLLELAGSITAANRLPRVLRGAAVLDALARRALARGGAPLMQGRGAALTALRAGILG